MKLLERLGFGERQDWGRARRRTPARVSVALLIVVGCGSTPDPVVPKQPVGKPAAVAQVPDKPAPKPEPVRVLPQLQTGNVAPEIRTDPFIGKVVGYQRTATTETFQIEYPDPDR